MKKRVCNASSSGDWIGVLQSSKVEETSEENTLNVESSITSKGLSRIVTLIFTFKYKEHYQPFVGGLMSSLSSRSKFNVSYLENSEILLFCRFFFFFFLAIRESLFFFC